MNQPTYGRRSAPVLRRRDPMDALPPGGSLRLARAALTLYTSASAAMVRGEAVPDSICTFLQRVSLIRWSHAISESRLDRLAAAALECCHRVRRAAPSGDAPFGSVPHLPAPELLLLLADRFQPGEYSSVDV